MDGGRDPVDDRGGVLVGTDGVLFAAGQDIVLAPPLPKLSLSETSTALAVVAPQRFLEG